MTEIAKSDEGPRFLGHPAGLFVLFFAEMWERFSYYGMRALLVFYMTKDFLAYGDNRAFAVYGAYTSMVYATPFIGGMIADKLIGARRAVVLGGALMAAGHLLMVLRDKNAFFAALALLIVGNGMFKPNISTIVGRLYPEGDQRRDGGFTLFYMGINLGAAMAPLLCGYVGETYGWHYGFGLATIGMLVGLAIFVMPRLVTQIMLGTTALAAVFGLVATQLGDPLMLGVNAPVAFALGVAAIVAVMAMNAGALPADAGEPTSPEMLTKPILGPLTAYPLVTLGAVIAAPLFAVIVQLDDWVPEWDFVQSTSSWSGAGLKTVFASAGEHPSFALAVLDTVPVPARAAIFGVGVGPTGMLLILFGGLAIGSIVVQAFQSNKVERERLFVVLVSMFFSMLFWAFFEQAGSSINVFTDRNVDRVFEDRALTQDDVGQTLTIQPTQEQLGYTQAGKVYTLDQLDAAKKVAQEAEKPLEMAWTVDASHVGMKVADSEVPASVFQAANPIFILLFGLGFTAMWDFLGRKNIEPSTPVKFAAGLLQLGLGFAALWYGATSADPRGMVGMSWLVLGYLLHTTGELCLSPVGLSMVTRLSPARMVSTTMGGWFLATAFSSYLSGAIAQLTGVSGEGGGDESSIPAPIDTVDIYGGLFGQIALMAVGAAALLLVLSPILNRWAHEDEAHGEAAARGGH